MRPTIPDKESDQMRLSFCEMIMPVDDEWAVINDHEQRLKRVERLLLDLKMKLENKFPKD